MVPLKKAEKASVREKKERERGRQRRTERCVQEVLYKDNNI